MQEDPWSILGLSAGASDDAIRQSYLQKVKAYPPERSPQEFERIRDAYDAVRDPRQRARSFLVSVDPTAPMASLLKDLPIRKQFVGPEPWMAVLRS